MYSLNAPVPSAVARLATRLADELPDARPRERGEHSLVLKRLPAEEADPDERDRAHRLQARLHEVLDGAPAIEARVESVDSFETPPAGPAPVVYLAVESPGLQSLHQRLCGEFSSVAGLEGDAYEPHVTVARGGTMASAERLADRRIEPIEWVIDELRLHSSRWSETVGRFALPS